MSLTRIVAALRRKKLLVLLAVLLLAPVLFAAYATVTLASITAQVKKPQLTSTVLQFDHGTVPGASIDVQIASGNITFEGLLGLEYTLAYTVKSGGGSGVYADMILLVVVDENGEVWWIGGVYYAPSSDLYMKTLYLLANLLARAESGLVAGVEENDTHIIFALSTEKLSKLIHESTGIEAKFAEDVVKVALPKTPEGEGVPTCALGENTAGVCVVMLGEGYDYPFYLPGGSYAVVGMDILVTGYIKSDTSYSATLELVGEVPSLFKS